MPTLGRAWRSLLNRPLFSLAAIATLGLGIGTTVSLWALVDATMLHPLPGVAAPEQLLAIGREVHSYPAFRDFRAALAGAEVAAYANRPLALAGREGSTRVAGAVVSGNLLPLLGARAARGRLLAPDDDRLAAPSVAVLSYAFWRARFGAAEEAVGSDLLLNGRSYRVVGVAAAELRGPTVTDVPQVWIPISGWAQSMPTSFGALSIERTGWSWLRLLARPRPGVGTAEIAAELAASAAEQRRRSADAPSDPDLRLLPAELVATGLSSPAAVRRVEALLAGVAVLVLLVAAFNAAQLLLARLAARGREIAARLALGASRRQLLGELIAEPLLLSLLAGAVSLLGVGLALAALGEIPLPGGFRLATLGLAVDLRMALVAVGVALATAAALVVGPVRRALRLAPAAVLHGDEPGRRLRGRAGASLVIGQVAVSLVLLVGAGLLGRALQRALAIDPGFAGDHLAMVSVDLGLARFDAGTAASFYPRALTAVDDLVEVESATWASRLPLTDDADRESIRVPGYTPAPDERPRAEIELIGPRYFATLGIPLAAGRDLAPEDRAGANRVVVVNEAFARHYFGAASALGRAVVVGDLPAEIIGVARDIRNHGLTEAAAPTLYAPLAQSPGGSALWPMTLIARVAGEPRRALPAIARCLAEAAPSAPRFDLGTFDDVYAAALAPQRLGAALLGLFGIVGLALAALGIFGVVAYTVSRRTREIGIRLAIGARPMAILRLFLAEVLRRVGLGLAAGLIGALAAGRVLGGLLYGVSPADPWTLGATALLLLVAALAAALLPARRAARLEPSSALRHE